MKRKKTEPKVPNAIEKLRRTAKGIHSGKKAKKSSKEISDREEQLYRYAG